MLHKFEGTKIESPAPPKRERFVSGVDGPRAQVEGVAAVERERAQNRASLSVPQSTGPLLGPVARKVPIISPSDSDEVQSLKREIIAKEAEIQALAGKFTELSDKLDRIVSMFQAAQNDTFSDPQTDFEGAVLSSSDMTFDLASPANETSSVTYKNRFEPASDSAVGRSNGVATERPASAPKTGGTLAEILAAARGGTPSSGRATSEKPKYASLLKNLK